MQKLRPYLNEAHTFALQLRDDLDGQIRDNLCGACAVASAWLMLRLHKAGITEAECVVGQGHVFVRVGEYLLDPTATQFGFKPFIRKRPPFDGEEYTERYSTDNVQELLEFMDQGGWHWDANVIYEHVLGKVG